MNATVAVSQAPDPGALSELRSGRTRHLLRAVCTVPLAAFLLGYVFPRVVGSTATDVRSALGAVSAREVLELVCLWAAGLVTHSFVLTGALPGLSRRRALTLNLTGSAVANSLPFGGAAGMSMNYVMIRAWGVEPTGFAAFTLVTNLWAVLLKLVMPVLALVALWASGGPLSGTIRAAALVSLTVLTLGLVVLVVAVADRRRAERTVDLMTPAVARVVRVLTRSRHDGSGIGPAILHGRDVAARVLRRSWPQLSVGTAGYGLLQAMLLWACLHAVGAALAPAAVLAGFAVDRVMTLAVVTPGAVGFAEAGTAAVLIALGGDPAAVAAGVLLYRGFTFALEIPVGGTWLAGWIFQRRIAARSAGRSVR